MSVGSFNLHLAASQKARLVFRIVIDWGFIYIFEDADDEILKWFG